MTAAMGNDSSLSQALALIEAQNDTIAYLTREVVALRIGPNLGALPAAAGGEGSSIVELDVLKTQIQSLSGSASLLEGRAEAMESDVSKLSASLGDAAQTSIEATCTIFKREIAAEQEKIGLKFEVINDSVNEKRGCSARQ